MYKYSMSFCVNFVFHFTLFYYLTSWIQKSFTSSQSELVHLFCVMTFSMNFGTWIM